MCVMKEGTIKLFSDARAPGVISPEGDGGRPIMVAAVRSSRRRSASDGSRTSMLKKLTLGTIVPLFAAISLFGCQSSQEQANNTEAAKAKASNTSAPKSDWPKMVTIPSGTTLLISLDTPLRTDANKSGDNFKARLYDAVRVDQMTVLPSGTEVRGRLTLVEQPHRTTGKAQMTLSFDQVVDPAGQVHSISAAPIVLVAAGDKISDEEKVVGGAVIGGLIGVLSSPKQQAKGAAVGAAAGAAAGGIVALATKGKQMKLPAGQRFAVDLNESLRVSVTQLTASR
jgi:outer membrane lipoprotein SlyB